MKRTFIHFFSVALAMATLSACCDKTEAPTPTPENQIVNDLKKGGGSQTATVTYGGRATGIDATIWSTQNGTVTSNQSLLAETYFLPATGGALNETLTSANIPGALTATSLNASATGQNSTTVSSSSVSTLNITVGGNTITADNVHASATTACGGIPNGTSGVTNLVVNGRSITVTGAPSQAIYLPNGGMIVLNVRSGSKKGSSYTMSVIGMHIILPNVADIKVASTKAEVKC